MTWIDYCILSVFIVSVLVGVWRGFTREVLSLATWIAAFVAAWLFSSMVGVRLEPHLGDPALREAAASAIVFLLALFAGAVITHFIVVAVRDSRFSPADRTMGGGLGVVRAVVAVSLFVLVAGRMGAGENLWWRQSLLIDRFTPLARGAETLIPARWLDLLKPALPSSSSSSQ
ncbi:CvpA family protein [Fontimonas sp. SYSU GA230001]|uniref:CvpA family protein n=1 Tax=Fontimonas sp. SYSU GA230001 TaxID=3142450 RepID=UPI0032B39E9C